MNKKVISYRLSVISYLLLATLYLLLTVNQVWSACTGLYCHGGQTVTWGQSLPSGGDCGPCHSSQGAGTAPEEFTWAHQIHSSTGPQTGSSGRGYAYACEICHARFNTDNNMTHANGPADTFTGGNRAAEVIFHNKELTWETTTYGNDTTLMYYISIATNPYNNQPVTPLFGQGTSTTAADHGYFGVTRSSCTNIWCHSNAVPVVGGTPQYKLAYSSDTNVSCTYCHGGPGNPNTTLSVAHATHTRVGSYNYKCYYCHNNTTVTESTYTIKYSSHHVNGTKTVDFSTHNVNASSYTAAGPYKCSNLYCHSDGITVWKGGIPSGSTPTWTSTGTVNCSSCHNGPPNGPGYKLSDIGKPNAHSKHLPTYKCNACHNWTANLVSGDNYTILYTTHHVNKVYTSTPSADYSFNYVFNSTPAASSCSNISCHGGTYTIWSDTAAIPCVDCHLAPVGQVERDDWVFGNNFTAKVSSSQWYSSSHGSSITCTGDGTYSGCHIQVSTNVPHNTAGNFFRLAISTVTVLCRDCHVNRVVSITTHTHSEAITGGNNWGSSGIAGSSTNTFKCVDCHDPHGDGYSKMVSSKVYTGTSDREGKPNFNIAFGTRPVIFTLSIPAKATDYVYLSTTAYPSDPTYGIFSNRICQVCHQGNAYHRSTWTWTTHIEDDCTTNCHQHKDGFKPSGCNTCHGGQTGATSENRSDYKPNNYWPDGSTRTASGSIADRAGAHEKHVLAIANRNGWTTLTDITNDANQKAICRYCHGQNIPPSGADHYVSNELEPATLPGVGLSTTTNGFQRLDSGATMDNGTYTFTGAGAVRYCDNVDCHWNARTPTTSDLGWYATDGSSKPAGADCRTCHQDSTVSNSSWPYIGAHKKHAGIQGGQEYYAYACEKCHPKNPGAPNFTGYDVKPATLTDTHNNNKVNWSFADIGNAFKSSFTAEGYSSISGFDLGTTNSTGTCVNVYCHGLQTTPQWNQTWADVYLTDTNSRKCSACHERVPTTIAAPTISISTFGHIAHTTFTAAVPLEGLGVSTNTTVTHYRYGCGNCHYETNQATTTLIVSEHAQGKFGWATGSSQTARVYFAPFATTTATGDTYISSTVWFRDSSGFQFTAGRCESVYCHGVSLSSGTRQTSPSWEQVSISTPNWNVDLSSPPATKATGSGACGTCHNLYSANSGIHRKHIGGVAGFTDNYPFDCTNCHRDVDISFNYQANVSSRTLHINKNKYDVRFDTFNPTGATWSP